MIPLDQCQKGSLYRIDSRNLAFGVFDGVDGFIGIREKFGSRYLFSEYHYDTGAPYGTVKPLELLEICPLSDIRETIGTFDGVTKRPVKFDTPIKDGGKGWYFEDTGEASESINPYSRENKDLFQYLMEKSSM